jgi:hypothetical protein
MTNFNTDSDSANSAVRAFLTKVGAFYNQGKKFNTSTGKGKIIWEKIKEEFENSCCYCGKKLKLTMEHLIMFNRIEYGIHHPGNIVPCCSECNKRIKKNGKYLSWKEHLKTRSRKNYKKRLKKIEEHITKYNYPKLTPEEIKTIKVIAESLYNHTKNEGEKSFDLYCKLREEFLKN